MQKKLQNNLPIIYGIGNCMTDFFVHLQEKDASFLGYKEASVNHIDDIVMQDLLLKLALYKPLTFTGGTTVNILKTIARHANILPVKLFLTGTVGVMDALGANFEKHISQKGITTFLRRAKGSSGAFVKIVPKNKEPILVASPSCAKDILPCQIDKELCKRATFIVIEGMLLQNVATFDAVVAYCNKYHTPLVIDCASTFGAKLLAPILQSIMQKDFSLIIFANEDETEILCNAIFLPAKLCRANGTDGACSATGACGADSVCGATGATGAQIVCSGTGTSAGACATGALNLAEPYCTIFVAKKSSKGVTLYYSARKNNLQGINLHSTNLPCANFLLHKTPLQVLKKPFDATGAGDAFAGAFLLALLCAKTNNLQALQKFAMQITLGKNFLCAQSSEQNASFSNAYDVLDFASSCGNACALNVLNHFGTD